MTRCAGCGGPLNPNTVAAIEGMCMACTARTARQNELEQMRENIADLMPPVWRAVYMRCLAEGFDDTEAMRLVQTYILSQCPYGVRGTA